MAWPGARILRGVLPRNAPGRALQFRRLAAAQEAGNRNGLHRSSLHTEIRGNTSPRFPVRGNDDVVPSIPCVKITEFVKITGCVKGTGFVKSNGGTCLPDEPLFLQRPELPAHAVIGLRA